MRTVVLAILRGYKRWLSPLLPPACRYVPSCSEYAEQAVEAHGVLKGSALAGWRLLRCHPLAKGGFDPVPHEIVWRGSLTREHGSKTRATQA